MTKKNLEIETETKAGRALGTEGETAFLQKRCIPVDGPSLFAIRCTYMQPPRGGDTTFTSFL